MSRITLCIAISGLAAAPHAARADSAVGADTISGNAFNLNAARGRALDPNWPDVDHTPTGQLYRFPYAAPDEIATSKSAWLYSGSVELGALLGGAGNRNAQFRMYKDVDNGLYLNNFAVHAEKPGAGYYADVSGGSLGYRDQFFTLQAGQYNKWRINTFYNGTPHEFTSSYKSLWTGVGTGNLSLVPGLTPGGTGVNATDNANVAAAIAGAGDSTLRITREKGAVRYDAKVTSALTAYASYSIEHRKGARPLGAVWGGGGGTAPMEIPEPISYDTHEVLAGLQYAKGLGAFNLRFSGSVFRNNNDTLSFQEPYRIAIPAGVTTVPAAGAFTQGRFDLAPNNEAYSLRAEFSRSFPSFYNTRLNAVVSAGRQRQNDNLIPYTSIPMTVANVSGNNWNTVDALSRRSAQGSTGTLLADLGLAANLTDTFNVKGKFRHYEAQNKTPPFLACNPAARYLDVDPNTAGAQPGALTFDGCTGVWGRLLNDGSGLPMLMGATSAQAGNLPIKSIPFGLRQTNAGVTADYQVNTTSGVNAAYEREFTHRNNRETSDTAEDKVKIGYVNRALLQATVRMSYEYDDRHGNGYVPDAYSDFRSGALVPASTANGGNVSSWAVQTNGGLRKFDIADRRQHVFNVRINTPLLREDLELGLAYQIKAIDYPNSLYGADSQAQNTVSADINYAPSSERSIYGSVSYQTARLKQNAIAGTGNCILGQATALGTITAANAAAVCQAPGGPIYPLNRAWSATSRDSNGSVTVGVQQELGPSLLNLNYVSSWGRARLGYSYVVGGAVTAEMAPFAGAGFPDIVTHQNVFDANLSFPVSNRARIRLLYRYEDEKVIDWHYRGLEASPVAGGGIALPTALVLDGGPQTAVAHIVGIFVHFSM